MFDKAVARWLGGTLTEANRLRVHENINGSRMNVDLQKCVADRVQQAGTSRPEKCGKRITNFLIGIKSRPPES